jgi:hypothetical protein
MWRGIPNLVFQVPLLKIALDETVSYPQNAPAPRNVFAGVSAFFTSFPRHFSSASRRKVV